MPSTPSRFPNGITNVAAADRLKNLPFLDPFKWQVWSDDFNTFRPDEWDIDVVDTDADSGDTRTIEPTKGGVLKLLNNDNAADSTNIALGTAASEPFLLESGKRAILLAKFSSSDVDKNFLAIGLAPISDRDLQGGLPADHFLFRVDTADANIDFSCAINGTPSTSLAIGTVSDYAAGTNNLTEVCAYYDGANTVYLYVDNAQAAKVDITSNLPNTEMTFMAEIHNSDAAADFMAIDYAMVAIER